MIQIRAFHEADVKSLWELFHRTIHDVNRKDYSQAQLDAWSPHQFDKELWAERYQKIQPMIAYIDHPESGVTIVGYADLQNDGLIDHFFCHHQYQGQGVGRTLMHEILHLAKHAQLPRLYSHVSLTAKPFFEHYGFRVVKKKQVNLHGVLLTNFLMEYTVKK